MSIVLNKNIISYWHKIAFYYKLIAYLVVNKFCINFTQKQYLYVNSPKKSSGWNISSRA
jgi:hypothetical protein